MLPSSPGKRFHVGREADITKYGVPVERECEVAERVLGSISRQIPGWKDCRLRNRYTHFCHQAVIEIFVICTPPEWIINNSSSCQGCILQPGTVKRNILRYAIDDHSISCWFALQCLIDTHWLSSYAGYIFAVYPCYKRFRKGTFLTVKDPDFFHIHCFR